MLTNENLVRDGFFDNPKRIELDSLALLNIDLDTLPENQWVVQYSGYGYIFFIYVFDQSKVPNVDTTTPGSVTSTDCLIHYNSFAGGYTGEFYNFETYDKFPHLIITIPMMNKFTF